MKAILYICLLVFLITEDFSLLHFHQSRRSDSQQLRRLLTKLIIKGAKSPPRPFFARINLGSTFCGASILSRQFLLTATSCVSNFFFFRPECIIIEIGDFSDPLSNRTMYEVLDYFVSPDYGLKDYPENNLALVKTTTPIANWKSMALPICDYNTPWDEMSEVKLAACGMGSVSTLRNSILLPANLQEVVLRQSVFEAVNTKEIVFCKNHTICTVPLVDGGSICNMDEGGPLYKLSYATSGPPVCLYGIATYYTSVSDPESIAEICNGGSYFASTMYYSEWIKYTVIANSD